MSDELFDKAMKVVVITFFSISTVLLIIHAIQLLLKGA